MDNLYIYSYTDYEMGKTSQKCVKANNLDDAYYKIFLKDENIKFDINFYLNYCIETQTERKNKIKLESIDKKEAIKLVKNLESEEKSFHIDKASNILL